MNNRRMVRLLLAPCLCVTAAAVFGVEAAGQLNLKPGFNLFSQQQDIDAGRQASADADKQLQLLNDAQVVRYINDLGRRLTQFEPLPADYPWAFKVVNTKDINAFALPGDFIYVNRGTIESAENEAQLAGVIAHETGHVVMRHGTHQASQMMLAQAPLSILGGLLGQRGSLTGQLTQMGIGFGVNSVLLHNSRTAESQADKIGTYVLYHAGYDPHAMAQFFQIVEQKYPQRTAQFFSDHPNPENRIQAVDAAVDEFPGLRQIVCLQSLPDPVFLTLKERSQDFRGDVGVIRQVRVLNKLMAEADGVSDLLIVRSAGQLNESAPSVGPRLPRSARLS